MAVAGGVALAVRDRAHAAAPDVLRHRILLSFEAEAEGISADVFIRELLQRVPVT